MFCSNCGAEVIREGAKFCNKCGKPLEDVVGEKIIDSENTFQPVVKDNRQGVTQKVGNQNIYSTYESVPKGSFWLRVGAALIDGLILLIVNVPLNFLFLAPKMAVMMTQRRMNFSTPRFPMPFGILGIATMMSWSLIVLIINGVLLLFVL